MQVFNSLRHSAGPLAFGLQSQSTGCVNLVGVKVGWCKSWLCQSCFKSWLVQKVVCVKLVCVEAGECVGPWRLNRKESSWYMQAAWLWECMRRRLLTHDFIPCHGRSQVSCFQVWFLRRAHNPWRTESCLCPFCIDRLRSLWGNNVRPCILGPNTKQNFCPPLVRPLFNVLWGFCACSVRFKSVLRVGWFRRSVCSPRPLRCSVHLPVVCVRFFFPLALPGLTRLRPGVCVCVVVCVCNIWTE